MNSPDQWVAYYLWFLLFVELMGTYALISQGASVDAELEQQGKEPYNMSSMVLSQFIMRLLRWSPVIAYVFGFIGAK